MNEEVRELISERSNEADARERLLRLLSISAFLVFFETYLFAPLLPSLATEFSASMKTVGWVIPAFMLPYGVSALFYGTLSDRLGRKKVLIVLLALVVLTTLMTATAHNITALICWRVIGGLVTGGIIPISIALIGDVFPYRERGRPIGWIYSGMAGGAAFGSTLGAYLNPTLGWRWELVAVAVLSAALFAMIYRVGHLFPTTQNPLASLSRAFSTYNRLLRSPRGWRAYTFVFFNSAFHSGVFSWLGLYFVNRYDLGDRGVGLALLGYGIPGMLFGPLIGRWTDRIGRNILIPIGLAVGSVSTFFMVPHSPIIWSTLCVAALSLGYDLTQPLFGGLVTSFDAKVRGQSISLSGFFLFVGFGFGPLIFQSFGTGDLTKSLLVFASVELVLAVSSIWIFKDESAAQAANQA